MNDYKDYDQLKKSVQRWLHKNPFTEEISVNGEILELSFNMVYTIRGADMKMKIGGSSRAQNISQTELKVHTLQHIDKILEFTKGHIESDN